MKSNSNNWKSLIDDFLAKEKKKTREPKFKQKVWRLSPGIVWNPLARYPRNKGCFCGSGVKSKRCCLPKISRAVPEGLAKEIKTDWEALMTGHKTLEKAP